MSTRRLTSGENAGQPPGPLPAETFGRRFQDPALLTRALTHRSLAYETNPEALTDPQADNEQLEFLGDAILGMLVAESLYRRFPASREGELTRLRASLVSRLHLGAVALRMDLGNSLRLGRGEEQSGGRHKPALLANALEAIIAAFYLDGGITEARAFTEKYIIEPAIPALEQALRAGDTFSGAIGDHKSALQEHLQAVGAGQPQYVLTAESGPDHDKRFRIQVRVEDGKGGSVALSESEGTTKKSAQQEAARLAFEHLLSRASPQIPAAPEQPVSKP